MVRYRHAGPAAEIDRNLVAGEAELAEHFHQLRAALRGW
jgi:hypothetical protein